MASKAISTIGKYAAKKIGNKTFDKAIQKISEEMINNNVDSNYKIYISHACNEKLAKDIKNIILEYIENADIEIKMLGPVFTTQGGPSCISVQYIKKHDALK